MKKLSFNKIGFIGILLLGIFSITTIIYAATSPSAGNTASYAVLSSTYTNTVPGTTINGDIGFTTGPAVTPAGTRTYFGSGAPYSLAGTDQATALSALNSEVCTFTFAPGAIDLASDTTHGPIGVYTPGVYCISGAANIGGGGTITLNGAGTYIFRMTGALNTTPNSIVALSGASACDVWWTPGQATTLGANSTFKGNNIDPSGITLGSNVNWVGRALAFGGTVTTAVDDVITVPPTCSVSPYVPPPTPPAGGGGGGGLFKQPIISIEKVPTPLALPSGPGVVVYNYTVTNIGKSPMTHIQVTDDKCPVVTYVSGDINNNKTLGLTETWKYTCTTTISQTTTNVVTAVGYAGGWNSFDTANATVVVGSALPPPLIRVIKTSDKFLLPYGGDLVTYKYTITNPGIVPMSNISITDDKCTGLPTQITGHPGDLNQNNLLDVNETFTFTCASNITSTTVNTATAKGYANGFTAIDYAVATVVVSAPGLPNTGFGTDNNLIWLSIFSMSTMAILASVYRIKQRRKN